MLNENIIKALEEKGFKRWTKGAMDRMYIDAKVLGLDVVYNGRGNVLGADFKGERISNNMAREMLASKNYVDIATGKVFSGSYTLKREISEIIESIETSIA